VVTNLFQPHNLTVLERKMETSTTTNPLICSDKVEGTAVYNTTGENLGLVDSLMLDKHTGQVRHAVLEFSDVLGLGTDRYPLPWSMLKIDTEHDGRVVSLDKNPLNHAPRYPHNDPLPFMSDAGGFRRRCEARRQSGGCLQQVVVRSHRPRMQHEEIVSAD
jgi:hypothetical protein